MLLVVSCTGVNNNIVYGVVNKGIIQDADSSYTGSPCTEIYICVDLFPVLCNQFDSNCKSHMHWNSLLFSSFTVL